MAERLALFRPCIDLHNGQVKQIVGGTLSDRNPDVLKTNFVAKYVLGFFLFYNLAFITLLVVKARHTMHIYTNEIIWKEDISLNWDQEMTMQPWKHSKRGQVRQCC